MNPLLKSFLLSLCCLILTALTVQAEEKSWYEIDGIKFRAALNRNTTTFDLHLPGMGLDNRTIMRDGGSFQGMIPIAITLPETLMSSWSFRGVVFEYQTQTEAKDLAPSNLSGDTTYLRQLSSLRTSLYNDFFNASDKAFADANSNWALSADVVSSRVFLGYYWGMFIPVGEYHRLLKIGVGLGPFYADLSYKLNLCSQYKVTSGDAIGVKGECVGKTEIDSVSNKWFGVASVTHFTVWEKVTKDSIWKIISVEASNNITSTASALKLKNHDKNLEVTILSLSGEIISYTYRF